MKSVLAAAISRTRPTRLMTITILCNDPFQHPIPYNRSSEPHHSRAQVPPKRDQTFGQLGDHRLVQLDAGLPPPVDDRQHARLAVEDRLDAGNKAVAVQHRQYVCPYFRCAAGLYTSQV